MVKLILCAMVLALSVSCAVNKMDEAFRIDILLNPKFPVALGLSDTGPSQAQLIDNDGNIYVTYWEVPEQGHEKFSKTVSICKDSLRDQRLFLSAYTIHDYEIEEIQPTLYKPFVRCIHKEGYKPLPNEAYPPEYFELSFSRTHSTKDNYIPVGSKFRIEKTNTPYIEAYKRALSCDREIISAGHGVNESYGAGYSSVSIETYIEEFQTCLESSGFKVEKT